MVRRFLTISFIVAAIAFLAWCLRPRGYVSTAVAVYDLPPEKDFDRNAAIAKVEAFIKDLQQASGTTAQIVLRNRQEYRKSNQLCCFELIGHGATPRDAQDAAQALLTDLLRSDFLDPVFGRHDCPPPGDECARPRFQPLAPASPGRHAH